MEAQKNTNKIELIGKPIKVRYKNWRSEIEERTIIPQNIYWGSTKWHKDEQWLLEVFDLDRNAERIYALQDIEAWFL